MSDFVGRSAELRTLEDAWGGPSSAFIPVYGRRRVGKSELLLRFAAGKQALYYLGKRMAAPLQVQELLTQAAAVLREPLLATMSTVHWKEALIAIVERARGRILLVLDEFQWLCEASPELPSVLQELWDREWRKSGRVMLVLCGSYVGFMEREVLGSRSPLFGRRTAQIQLRPFGLREASAFHPRWSLADRARAAMICGGVPLYLRAFDPARSIAQNVQRAMLEEHAPLYREPDFLLREELRDVESYYGVLLAIAEGRSTTRAIAERAAVPERSLHYYVQQLEALGYVSRRYPLTGGPRVARQVRFVLEDPLLRFWFRFVFPNTSFLQQMGAAACWRERIAPEIEAWFGIGFERLCREALGHLYAEEGVAGSWEIGEYWDKEVQIDVVGIRGDGWIDLAECKWGAPRSLASVRTELERKVEHYPNPRNATIGRRVFVQKRPGRADAHDEIRVHDLTDLYGDA